MLKSLWAVRGQRQWGSGLGAENNLHSFVRPLPKVKSLQCVKSEELGRGICGGLPLPARNVQEDLSSEFSLSSISANVLIVPCLEPPYFSTSNLDNKFPCCLRPFEAGHSFICTGKPQCGLNEILVIILVTSQAWIWWDHTRAVFRTVPATWWALSKHGPLVPGLGTEVSLGKQVSCYELGFSREMSEQEQSRLRESRNESVTRWPHLLFGIWHELRKPVYFVNRRSPGQESFLEPRTVVSGG